MKNSPSIYQCTMEWGQRGALAAAERGDILIVVDVLSFCSCVAIATDRGARIIPVPSGAEMAGIALFHGAELAVHRTDVPANGRYSLSPTTFADVNAGTAIVLPSPNGATCAHLGGKVPYLFGGCLLNAEATAKAVQGIMNDSGLNVSVVACGERWNTPSPDGAIRFAIEDYLGAGAIIAQLNCLKSPSAQVCGAAFMGSCNTLEEIIHRSESGQELVERGHTDDVDLAVRLNLLSTASRMHEGQFQRVSIVPYH